MIQFDFMYLTGAAIAVVGVMEWLKGFFPVDKVPSWVWRALMAPTCVAIAAAGGGALNQILSNGAALIAITQIGYPVLVQLPIAVIEKFRKSLGA